MSVFFVLIAYSVILLYEGFPLLKEQKIKQLTIYVILITISLIISILLALDVKLFNPAEIIKNIVLYVDKLIKGVI